ncbi:MAG: rhodanese-like domain-containing protein [Microthrixaceae bacterium]
MYCRSGRRSEVAAQLLVEAGFTQVYDLGGVQDWDPEELSVES